MANSPAAKKKFGPPANSYKQRKQQELAWALRTIKGSKSNLHWIRRLGSEFAFIALEIESRMNRVESMLKHELKNIK